VEKVAKWYSSFEDVERDSIRRYAMLSPLERLRILFTLVNPRPDDPNTPRLERTAQFIDLRKR